MVFDLNMRRGVLLKVMGRIIEWRVQVKPKLKRKHLASTVEATCFKFAKDKEEIVDTQWQTKESLAPAEAEERRGFPLETSQRA